MKTYYSVSVGEMTEDLEGTARLWFITEEAMRAIEASCMEKFGEPTEGITSPDRPTVVMLAESS